MAIKAKIFTIRKTHPINWRDIRLLKDEGNKWIVDATDADEVWLQRLAEYEKQDQDKES